MDLELIKDKAWELMGKRFSHPDREPGYAYYHGQRVGTIALELRELIFPEEDGNDEVILVGSWFHDVSKGIEPHWEHGALMARAILEEFCTPVKLEQIVAIVGGHTLRKQGDYPNYVKLVQDADILDHFGSQEIWINFWHCAYRRQTLENSLDFYSDFYAEHVQRVRELLNYPESIAFFDDKDQFVRNFVERFRREAAGELIAKKE